MVLVDDLVDPGVLRYVRRSARAIPVGKRGGCVSTPQAFIHRLMVAQARKGERVVRLKGGDPFVFGRGGEELDALRAAIAFFCAGKAPAEPVLPSRRLSAPERAAGSPALQGKPATQAFHLRRWWTT